MCVAHARPSMRASSLVTSAVGFSRSGGAPGTPSAWETPPTAPIHRRLVLSGGFTVIDAQQRHLHDRVIALGFADVAGYLTARCQQQASLARLAGELATTTLVARRLLDHAGLTPPLRRLIAARQRRRATDQHLAARAAQLGFPSLQAYLVDRVSQQGWKLSQVASELGIDRNTVRDRLDQHGLRRTKQIAR
jgi:hypothetical protein